MTFDLYADRGMLLDALNRARPFVSNNKDGAGRFAHFVVSGTMVTITANNGEAFGVVHIVANTARPGEAHVNLSSLLDDVKAIRDAAIHLEVIGTTLNPRLRVSGATDTRITPLLDEVAAGVLPVPTMPDGGWRCTAGPLSRALEAVSFAIATEDVRWGLNGAHVEIDKDNREELRIVATDGHRLAVARVGFKGDFALPRQTLIPRQACRDLAHIDAGELRMVIDDGWLHASVGTDLFGWRLLDGEFPNYHTIVPTETRYSVRFRRADLLAKVKAAASIVSRAGKTYPIHFIAKDGEISIRLQVDGRESLSTLAGDNEGVIDAGFNAAYLADALDALECDQARIRINNPLAPAIVEPDDAGGSFGVVMPMRID